MTDHERLIDEIAEAAREAGEAIFEGQDLTELRG